ncbi:unnamed protein product [Adineta steineri]|uniref:Glycosyltransferase 2-like domain-containing protein n=2 Tax=Adineta steineri TaxID=433720 RepID=A0A814GT95_9BILA|nr:unnamed protein product [Adineta steineri]
MYRFRRNTEQIQSNYDDKNANIGFTEIELLQAKQREIDLIQNYTLSAIVLHWKRSASVARAVNNLVNSKLFKEIVIWNNNPQITLEKTQFQQNTSFLVDIRVINSKENLKDEAKYRACAEANNIACFYADDDWDASFYLKSLIADFRADPYVLHSVTDPGTFYTNLMWSYFDRDINLHTGFSWIGCGSIFLREYAQRHIEYLHTYLKNNRIGHTRELQNNIDMNLSFDGLLWTTYPSKKGITIRSQNSTSNKEQYKIIFNSSQFNLGFRSFRYVAFNASKISYLEELQVCDVKIITSTNITTL